MGRKVKVASRVDGRVGANTLPCFRMVSVSYDFSAFHNARPGRPWRLTPWWPAADLEALDGREPDVELEMNVEAHRERCGTMPRDHSRHLQPIGSSIASVSGSGEHLFGTPLGTVRTSSGGSGSARVGKPDELPRASRGSVVRLRDRCGTANAPDAPFPAWGGSGGWLHLGSPSALRITMRCWAGPAVLPTKADHDGRPGDHPSY